MRHATRIFGMDEFIAICVKNRWRHKRKGAVVEVDCDNTGHHEYKCTPSKGCYITSGGEGKTIAQLLWDKKAEGRGRTDKVPAIPKPYPRAEREKKLTAAKFLEGSLPRVLPDGSLSRLIHQAAWTAVERYLRSRGLDNDALPPEARVKRGKDSGYDLIIPLQNGQPDNAVHVTMIAADGQKRPQKWLGGDCRITPGSQKRPGGGNAYAVIPEREQVAIRIPGHDGPVSCIGEGLESTGTGNLLTGHSAVFAVNKAGLAAFLDDPVILKGMKQEGRLLVILVDRDVSGDGQKFAAKIALKCKRHGIPYRFCVPTEPVKGGKKGADWNDAGQELGVEGARAALIVAIEQSDTALAATLRAHPEIATTAEVQTLVPIARIRPAAETPPSPPLDRKALDEAAAMTRSAIRGYLLRGVGSKKSNKKEPPVLIATDCGVGKSRIAAEESGRIAPDVPVLMLAPTRALAEEAAENAAQVETDKAVSIAVAPARNEVSCQKFPDVIPFGRQWRSIVPHLCQHCEHGDAAMDIVRPLEDGLRCDAPSVEACRYILETYESRAADLLCATGAKAESGDEQLFRRSGGEDGKGRKAIFDDTTALNQHRSIVSATIGDWVRTAKLVAPRGMSKGIVRKNAKKERAAKLTLELIPHLSRLHNVVATHLDDDQIPLKREDWTDLCRIVQDTAIDVMDGTMPETVHLDNEGKTQIPLRALRDVAEAIERGTVWITRGRDGSDNMLHVATPTVLAGHVADGAMVMDATPSWEMRKFIQALGGKVVEARVEQNGLKTILVRDGAHGKSTCHPQHPSFGREKKHLLDRIREVLAILPDKSLPYILSHLDFIEAILDEIAPTYYDNKGHPRRPEMTKLGIPTANFGWFGYHDRGQNDWKDGIYILQWGVSRLSPRETERQYMASRQSIIEAGGIPPAIWDGERTSRTYRIPGTELECESKGYASPEIDAWDRDFVTGATVQAGGRFRAARRQGVPLTHEIHSTFPFSDDHGFRIDEVRGASWRDADGYQQDRKDSQLGRAVIGLALVRAEQAHDQGRRTVNAALAALGLPGIDNNAWAEIARQADGLLGEYTLSSSQTTTTDTRALEKAYADVAEALPTVAALDFSDLVVLSDPDLSPQAGFTPAERVAGLVLQVAQAPTRVEIASGGPPVTG